MKIQILSYKLYRGCKVKVQSHNQRNGKWKENPHFKFHLSLARQDGTYEKGGAPVSDVKKITREV